LRGFRLSLTRSGAARAAEISAETWTELPRPSEFAWPSIPDPRKRVMGTFRPNSQSPCTDACDAHGGQIVLSKSAGTALARAAVQRNPADLANIVFATSFAPSASFNTVSPVCVRIFRYFVP
jgi:hypothetical protein